MKMLRFILQKEFRQIFRNKSILAMMFVMPIVQLIILPTAMNFNVKNVNVSVVDNNHSSYSQKLISKIGASGYFNIVSSDESYKKALTHIEDGTADLVMEIPINFEKNLVREGSENLGISVDAINGTKSLIGSGYLNQVIAQFAASLNLNPKSPVGFQEQPVMINISSSNWYNPLAEYKYYVVPAVMVLLLTLIGGFISALNIVKEKEVGTIEQINVSPINKWQFILGKLIPFLMIGLIVFTISLGVCWIVYGIIPQGIGILYLFATVYMIALLGFGLLISTFCDSQVQAMFVAFFFVMIFVLMSGLFTSVESMPDWARTVSNCTPITHFIKVIRMVILKGSGFGDVKMELLYLVIFALFLNTLAILNYKKTS